MTTAAPPNQQRRRKHLPGHEAAARLTVVTDPTRPGILIAADNTSRGTTNNPAAFAEAGACIATTAADHLVAVDIDQPDDHALVHAVATAARNAGLGAVTVNSGRPGHQHLWINTGNQHATRQHLTSLFRQHGWDVRTVIRPPGIPHRTGTAAATNPADTTTVINELTNTRTATALQAANATAAITHLLPATATATAAAGADARRDAPDTQPNQTTTSRQHELPYGTGQRRWPNLAASVWRTITHGHANRYRSPSEARAAVAVAVIAAGGTRDHLWHIYTNPRWPIGATFRNRPERWQHEETDRLATKARHWLNQRHQTVATWLQTAHTHRWAGTSGATDLAVIEHLARNATGPTVAGSAGTVAAGAAITPRTARRSLQRLVDAGWLARARAGTATRATLWKLTTPTTTRPDTSEPDLVNATTPTPTVPQAVADLGYITTLDSLGDLGRDAGRRRSIGKAALRVLRLIADGTNTHTELAERIGVGTSTIRRHLYRLRDNNLISRTSHGWALTTTTTDNDDNGTAPANTETRLVIIETRDHVAGARTATLDAWTAATRSWRERLNAWHQRKHHAATI